MRGMIKTLLASAAGAAGLAALMLVPTGVATSADHLDPPGRTDGGVDANPDIPADIADVFAWHSNGTTKISMTFAGPVSASATTPLYYDRDVLYKINISTQAPASTPEFTIKYRFGKGAGDKDWGVRIEGLPGVTGVLEGPVESNLEKDGVKVRVGLFDEPFFFDLIGFRETRSTGVLRIRNDRNFFDGQNDTAIVVEIPDANLGAGTTNLGIWGQTARFGGNI